MSDDGKSEGRVFPIRWGEEDWALIEEGMPLLKAETHVDVTPTDFIRAAVRRLHADLTRATAA